MFDLSNWVAVATILTPIILVVELLVTIHYKKRRISFIGMQMIQPTQLKIFLSGNSERGIKPRQLFAETLSGIKSIGTEYWPLEQVGDVKEGEMVCSFEQEVRTDQIHKVTILDNTNGKHVKYAYKGGFRRNGFIVWSLLLRDEIMGILKNLYTKILLP